MRDCLRYAYRAANETGKRTRVRILYVILLILIGITVGPLWFYGSKMMSMNRERLETQESVLQTITSQSLSQVISLYMENLNQQLKEFFDTVVPLATHIPAAKYSSDHGPARGAGRFRGGPAGGSLCHGAE